MPPSHFVRGPPRGRRPPFGRPGGRPDEPRRPHVADALVFFGATGDLAYKKIFPSLQAMVRARPPGPAGDRRGQGGLGPGAVPGPRPRQPGQTRRLRPAGRAEAAGPAALCRRRLWRCRHLRPTAPDAGCGATADALPGHPAGAVSQGGGTAGRCRLHAGCARRRGKALRPRRGFGHRAERGAAGQLRRSPHLPHRPLPGQRAGAQHAALPLCQRLPRTLLEPQPHRKRADHDGRGLWRAGPRRLLRRHRHGARRGAEPPVPGAGQPGDGAARAHRQRIDPRREDQAAARGAHAAAGRPGARPVRRLPGRARRAQRLGHRNLRRAAPVHRQLALDGRALLHPRRQEPARHLHRTAGAAEAHALGVFGAQPRRRTTCACASARTSRWPSA